MLFTLQILCLLISNFDQTPISGGYVSEQIAEDMEETGKEILNDVVKEIPAGVKVKSVFEVGSPGPALLAVAKKIQMLISS